MTKVVTSENVSFVQDINKRIISIPNDWRLAISPNVIGKIVVSEKEVETPPAQYRFGSKLKADLKSELLTAKYEVQNERLIDTFENAVTFTDEFNSFCWELIMNSSESAYADDDIEKNKKDIGANPFFSQQFWAGRYAFKKVLLARITVNSVFVSYKVKMNSKAAFFLFLVKSFANVEVEDGDNFVFTIPLLQENKDSSGAFKNMSDENEPIWIDLDDDNDTTVPCLANIKTFSMLTIPTDLKPGENKLLSNITNDLNGYITELKTYEMRSQTGLAEGSELECLSNIFDALKDKVFEHIYNEDALSKLSKRRIHLYSKINRGKDLTHYTLNNVGLTNWYKKSPYDRGGIFKVIRGYINELHIKMQFSIKGSKFVVSSVTTGTTGLIGTSRLDFTIITEFFSASLPGKSIITVGSIPTEKYHGDLTQNDFRQNKLSFVYDGSLELYHDTTLMPHYRILVNMPKFNLLDGDFKITYKVPYLDDANKLQEYKHQFFNIDAYDAFNSDKLEKTYYDVILPLYGNTYMTLILRDLKVGEFYLPLLTEYEIYSQKVLSLGVAEKDKFTPYNDTELKALIDMDQNVIKDFSGLSNRLGVISSELAEFVNSSLAYLICVILGTPKMEEVTMKVINKNINSFKDRRYGLNSVTVENPYKLTTQSKENRLINEVKKEEKVAEVKENIESLKESIKNLKPEVQKEWINGFKNKSGANEENVADDIIETSNEKE